MKRALPLVLAILALTACGSTSSTRDDAPSPSPSRTPRPLASAADECSLPEGVVQDSGATLILDGRGNDDYQVKDGKAVWDESKLEDGQLSCVLRELHTPDSIKEQIEHTRALDGRQTATADGRTYSWTYHPDDGLDLIVTTAST